MMRARLTRVDSTEQGTIGELQVGFFRCFTMEPPWRDNETNRSSIPFGCYPVVWAKSPRYGWCYSVLRVPGRFGILIHPGNIVQHTLGCILPGSRVGRLPGPDAMQVAVLVSRTTTRRLGDILDHKPFELEIIA